MSKDKKEKFKMEISLKTLDFCRDLIWTCSWAYFRALWTMKMYVWLWNCVYTYFLSSSTLLLDFFWNSNQNASHAHIFITAILAGNDTFLTENITQDRKRSKTYILIKGKLSEGWWSAFVISAKKKFFPSWAWPITIPLLCILVPKNNF